MTSKLNENKSNIIKNKAIQSAKPIHKPNISMSKPAEKFAYFFS